MTSRARTRATFRRTPLTLRASLPSVGWVDLVAQLKSRIADVDWDHRLPGGPAKVNIKLTGQHRLLPGTLLAIFDGSCPIWSGEIEATDPDPVSRSTSITGRGRIDTMQDGIIYDKAYIVADLGRWRDTRTFLGVDLAVHTQDFRVEQDDRGGIVLSQPDYGSGAGVTWPVSKCVGVTLDLGPGNAAASVAFDWDSTNNTDNSSLYTSSHSGPYWISSGGAGNYATNTPVDTGTSGSAVGNFPTGYRFCTFFLYQDIASVYNGDVWMKIKAARIFTSATYRSGGASILTVDTVAKDIVANAGIPSISTSVALIAAGTTAIQELYSNADNPRSLLDRANAVDGLQWLFTNDPIPALVLRAEPTAVRWAPLPGEVLLEGGANASSIVDVYNQVRVRWTDANGGANVTTATLTPDTSVLARVGRTRTADINVSRICSSTEAAAIAAAFLRQHRQAPIKASIKTTVPWIRTASGMRMPVTMLTAGDRIRLPIRDTTTGAMGREGIIYGVAVNPRTGVATISLDSDTTIFDRQLAYFESRAAS